MNLTPDDYVFVDQNQQQFIPVSIVKGWKPDATIAWLNINTNEVVYKRNGCDVQAEKELNKKRHCPWVEFPAKKKEK